MKQAIPGGAGSEVWNRVYMIATVKKFGRVRLSTNFPWKQIWRRKQTWRTMSFCSVLSFPAYQEKVSMNFFNEPFGHQEAWCMNSSWVYHLSWFGISASSVMNFRATILLHLLYFSTYSSIKTLFLILNICYEHNILVWVLQQSCVNFH